MPTHWYEGYDHIGYDVSGTKVVPEKPLDGLDLAIEADDGVGVTVYDKLNGGTLGSRSESGTDPTAKKGALANPETEMYPDTYRSSVIEHTPLHNAPGAETSIHPLEVGGHAHPSLGPGLGRWEATNKGRE